MPSSRTGLYCPLFCRAPSRISKVPVTGDPPGDARGVPFGIVVVNRPVEFIGCPERIERRHVNSGRRPARADNDRGPTVTAGDRWPTQMDNFTYLRILHLRLPICVALHTAAAK